MGGQLPGHGRAVGVVRDHERLPGIIGSLAIEWDPTLPPAPEEIWLDDCTTVARKLATHGGHALV